MKRLLLRTAATLAAGYALLALFALLLAGPMIFCPHRADLPAGAPAVRLRSADGAAIAAVHLPNDAARFTVLYSYGNGDDLAGALPFLRELRDAGFAVLAYDYPGYGMSSGRPSERGLYRAADAAYDYLTAVEGVPPERIIVFGRSLGGAVAADLAARRPVAALVMESSFVTAFRVMTRAPLLPFDQFRSNEKVRRVRCPVLFIHGTADRTIPDWHGRALWHAANQPKRLVLVEHGGHNDLAQAAGPRYFQIVRDFADSVP